MKYFSNTFLPVNSNTNFMWNRKEGYLLMEFKSSLIASSFLLPPTYAQLWTTPSAVCCVSPVDPFYPGSPIKTSGGADLLAADWSSGGAANGNGGALGGAGGSPSHVAPQVHFHIKSFL